MRRKWLIPVIVIAVMTASVAAYAGNYYHADPSALTALVSDETVHVTETDYGWFFDGPSEGDAMVFYPGAKIETISYAPLLHLLAGQGMDVCLVEMPLRLAFLGMGKAGPVMDQYEYNHWYVGGHSLGGAMAAVYAAEHGEQLTGLILLAAYPTKELDDALLEISIYGSEDLVLNPDKMIAGKAYAPSDFCELVIEGGNHAQFGNYGYQKGDGIAAISCEEQQRITVDFIISNMK